MFAVYPAVLCFLYMPPRYVRTARRRFTIARREHTNKKVTLPLFY